MNATFWAAYSMHSQIVPRVAAALHRPVVLENPEAREAQWAARQLEAEGIIVCKGAFVKAGDAELKGYEAGPWQQDRPMATIGRDDAPSEARQQPASITREPLYQRYLSKVLAVGEAIAAQRLWDSLDAEHRRIMLSSGGRGTGVTWIANHLRPDEYMQNSHFVTATMLRLGCKPKVRCRNCMLAKQKDGEVCGESIDANPFHPEICKCGAARARPHHRMEVVLQKQLQSTDAEVDLERIIPELSAEALGNPKLPGDAKMDLVVSWSGQLTQYWIDVSIRSPHAQHVDASDRRAGAAAHEGEKEKAARYGELVLPLVYETYGRLGYKSQQTLDSLVAAARTFGKATPGAVRRRRLAIERQLLFSTADSYLRSLNNSPGWLVCGAARAG